MLIAHTEIQNRCMVMVRSIFQECYVIQFIKILSKNISLQLRRLLMAIFYPEMAFTAAWTAFTALPA